MKALIDVDDLGNTITQAIIVDYNDKIEAVHRIYSFTNSFVEFGEGISSEHMAYAEEVWEQISERMLVLKDFSHMVNNIFPWDAIVRSPLPDVGINQEDIVTESLIEAFEGVGLARPEKIIRIPIVPKHKETILAQQIFDENYVLITTSENLARISALSDLVHSIIIVVKPWNTDLYMEYRDGEPYRPHGMNTEPKKLYFASDIVSAAQTYFSIINDVKQTNGEELDKR